MTEQSFMDVPTAARQISVSVRTLERMFQRGLPCYRTSTRGKRLIRPEELRDFLVKQQAASTNLDALVHEVAASFVAESNRKAPHGRPR